MTGWEKFSRTVGAVTAMLGLYYLGVLVGWWANAVGLPIESSWFFPAFVGPLIIVNTIDLVMWSRSKKNEPLNG